MILALTVFNIELSWCAPMESQEMWHKCSFQLHGNHSDCAVIHL